MSHDVIELERIGYVDEDLGNTYTIIKEFGTGMIQTEADFEENLWVYMGYLDERKYGRKNQCLNCRGDLFEGDRVHICPVCDMKYRYPVSPQIDGEVDF